MRRLGILLLTFTLAGCSSTNIAELVKAAGQDQASVCASVSTVYGIVKFARTNLQNGNLSCSQEGLTLKSDAAQVGVPITIVPNVSIGQPTVGPPQGAVFNNAVPPPTFQPPTMRPTIAPRPQ